MAPPPRQMSVRQYQEGEYVARLSVGSQTFGVIHRLARRPRFTWSSRAFCVRRCEPSAEWARRAVTSDGSCFSGERWTLESRGSVAGMNGLAMWARELARQHMAAALPQRWTHVQAVAAKAEFLRPAYEGEGEVLVAAAWLHDIGYAPTVQSTGFHPLDGARYLRSLGADLDLCGLVAHHSGARYEAELRGLANELAQFPDNGSPVQRALWFCDITTSPVGESVSFDERLAELRERYGPAHLVPRGITAAAAEIRAAIAAVGARARERGLVLD
jgi:hypothetical protein